MNCNRLKGSRRGATPGEKKEEIICFLSQKWQLCCCSLFPVTVAALPLTEKQNKTPLHNTELSVRVVLGIYFANKVCAKNREDHFCLNKLGTMLFKILRAAASKFFVCPAAAAGQFSPFISDVVQF